MAFCSTSCILGDLRRMLHMVGFPERQGKRRILMRSRTLRSSFCHMGYVALTGYHLVALVGPRLTCLIRHSSCRSGISVPLVCPPQRSHVVSHAVVGFRQVAYQLPCTVHLDGEGVR